ncbi:MAG: UshA-like (seleno)protein [Thermodesulfobacteriota bacterium]
MGGLSKKAFQIQQLGIGQRLLLDSGNLLFKRSPIAPGVNQTRLTAEAIIDIYQDLHYDAVGVGPLDLAGGLEFLRQSKERGFPWVSANLFDDKQNPLFPQWIRREKGKTEIFVTAISAAAPQMAGDFQIKSWKSVLPGLLQRIKTESKEPFIILLSTLSDEENRLIAEKHPDIHLLIGGDQRKGNISPRIVDTTLLTQTSKQGKYQGLIEIQLGRQRQWVKDAAKELAELQNRLGSVNWQFKRLEKKASTPGSANTFTAPMERLRKEIETLETAITSAAKRVETEKTGGITGDLYNSRLIELKSSMPDDPAISRKLAELRQRIRKLHGNRKVAALQRGMLGNNGCDTCHPTQTAFWKETDHAQAYTTLVDKEKNLDLDCLPCHLTRDLQNPSLPMAQSTALLAFPAELRGVGCESCHGAGQKHGEAPEQVKLVLRPGKETCLTCHSDEHDDDFNYDLKLPQISCPAG